MKGPFTDKRVRQAANYALNREDMKELLNGLMLEGYATVPPSTPYYGHPMIYKYDPDKAKALLKEAGCLPCKVTFAISTSGSGQMQPLPMNELVKSQLDAVGFRGDARSRWTGTRCSMSARAGVDEVSRRSRAINVSRADAGSVQRADPPRLDRRMGAEGRQLGPLQRSRRSTSWSRRSSPSSIPPSGWRC